MGKTLSRMTRPLRNINIDRRAEKVISKEKPTPAPVYKSVEKQKELAQKLYPNFMEMHYKKDPKLDSYLKDVYVKSTDPPNINDQKSKDNYPQKGVPGKEFEFGFWEPSSVPVGKCTLRDILTFMADHLNDPQKYSVEKIASEYKLDPKAVGNIIEYYKLLKLVEKQKPEDSEEDSWMNLLQGNTSEKLKD